MTAHNFNRTTCACDRCIKCCKRQPGSLAAGDYEAIQKHLSATDEEMRSRFWASPGALVRDNLTGRVTRIGSITPRIHRGRCVFLDDNDRCSIHAVAPFGCSMFDTHMSPITAQPRSMYLAKSQLDENYQQLRRELPYARSYKPTAY